MLSLFNFCELCLIFHFFPALDISEQSLGSIADTKVTNEEDVLDSLPNEIDIEVLSSASKVAVSVEGTQVRPILIANLYTVMPHFY